jgi:ssDNA-binding Zn-finger/Zn-ribbon topoisomerase 1
MPYLDCPNCRLTVYAAPRLTPIAKCPRCGSKRLGEPGRLFRQVRKFQRSAGRVTARRPNRPAAGK